MCFKRSPVLLLVEDDPALRRMLEIRLKREGFGVRAATRGEEALFFMERYSPDLLILDLMLPGIDGLEVLRRLRRQPQTRSLPVLILTARSREEDVVQGLELGADDYLRKPFSVRELVARIRALLRRVQDQGEPQVLRIGPFTVWEEEGVVTLYGRELSLSPIERKLLIALLRRPGRVLNRKALLDLVWEDRDVLPRVVDATVKNLRKKLGPYRHAIVTVRGIGYRFDLLKVVSSVE